MEDEKAVPLEEQMDRLINSLADRLQRTPTQPVPGFLPKLETPTFSGTGDVEFFIQKFTDVADISNWDHRVSLLKLREALQGKAEDCARGDNIDVILQSLRMRFGTSPAEANSRLAGLRRSKNTGLQEYATEVERLVMLANPEMPATYRHALALRTFKSTLGHSALQQHMLLAPIQTIEDAIRIGNDFLQIQSHATSSHAAVDTSEPAQQAAPVQSNKGLEHILAKICERLEKLERWPRVKPKPKAGSQEEEEFKCWGCGQPGHRRARCPTNPWTSEQGNGASPRP